MERIPGLDEWLTRGPDEQDHDPRCPCNEDWQCDDCIKVKAECCEHSDGLDCICAELEADAEQMAADAKYEALKERIWGD